MPGAARQLHTQQLHYLRKRLNFNDAGVATGVLVGTVPAGAIIDYSSETLIATAFNGGTTNVLVVGTTPGGNNLSANATSAAGVAGTKRMVDSDALGPFAVDTDIWATYTSTGTAPSAGIAYLVVKYIPNNDL